MKKVLILVLSSDFSPYSEMIRTSQSTWDSIGVAGCETFFYCSQNDNPGTSNHDNVMYFDVPNDLYSMGHKNLAMFEWALQNKEFDYVCRLNASHFCDKKLLVEYVQTLPETNLFAGAKVNESPEWLWGGTGFIVSKDVIEKLVQHGNQWQHDKMEDRAISYLATELAIPFYEESKACSIDVKGDAWQCISYCGKSIDFSDFNALKELGHIIYRVKQDGHRYMDTFIMNELFKNFQHE